MFGVQPSDVGTYKCHASNAAGSADVTATMILGADPYTPSHPVVTDVAGGTVHLEWNAPPAADEGKGGKKENI